MEFKIAQGRIIVRDDTVTSMSMEILSPTGDRLTLLAVSKEEIKRLAKAL